jgi:chemotaxis response regulator CheB
LAGGLDASIRLLKNLLNDLGVAVVIVNHITIVQKKSAALQLQKRQALQIDRMCQRVQLAVAAMISSSHLRTFGEKSPELRPPKSQR